MYTQTIDETIISSKVRAIIKKIYVSATAMFHQQKRGEQSTKMMSLLCVATYVHLSAVYNCVSVGQPVFIRIITHQAFPPVNLFYVIRLMSVWQLDDGHHRRRIYVGCGL